MNNYDDLHKIFSTEKDEAFYRNKLNNYYNSLEKIKDKNKMPYFKKTHQGLLPMASSSSF